MKTISCIAFLLFSLNSSAFRSSDYQSFTDPDYINFQPKHTLVHVSNASSSMRIEIEKRVEKYFTKKGMKVSLYSALFPPTRKWSYEQIDSRITQYGIDSVLVITPGMSTKQVIPIMKNTFSNTNINGTVQQTTPNSARFNGNAQTNSNTYTTNYAKSKAEFSAILFDPSNGKTAWMADIVVKAGGTFFVSEKGDAKGAVKTILKALEKDGHTAK